MDLPLFIEDYGMLIPVEAKREHIDEAVEQHGLYEASLLDLFVETTDESIPKNNYQALSDGDEYVQEIDLNIGDDYEDRCIGFADGILYILETALEDSVNRDTDAMLIKTMNVNPGDTNGKCSLSLYLIPMKD